MDRFDTTRWTLIQAAQHGDAEARNALGTRYRAPVAAYLRRRLPTEAEDLA